VVRKFESLASESVTLNAYLREIANFPSLTPADEVSLAQQIQEHGDEDALGRLVQSNLRFVVTYARRFRRLGVPLLDLIHEGNLGLIEAARRFDPSRDMTFQNSAVWWIRQAVMHLLDDVARTSAVTSAGLMAAAVAGRQVEAIRVGFNHAHATTEAEQNFADVDLMTAASDDGSRQRAAIKRPRRRAGRRVGPWILQALRQHSVLHGYLN